MSPFAGLGGGALSLLAGSALIAGFLDAIAGGGSLVMLPAFDEALPAVTPVPVLLGTNKLVDLSGNLAAIRTYVRGGSLRGGDAFRFATAGALGGVAGARLSFLIKAGWLPWLLLAILPPMLVLTLLQAGSRGASPEGPPPSATWPSLLAAAALGVYDGLLGAGTGALLVFTLVQMGRHNHLQAVAAAKAIHGGSNLAALAFFAAEGRWLPGLAITLAVLNAAGGFLGARLALRLGPAWVRGLFLATVGALMLKLGLSLWGR